MGWMAWDLIRGVDVLLKQADDRPEPHHPVGAVAGGGTGGRDRGPRFSDRVRGAFNSAGAAGVVGDGQPRPRLPVVRRGLLESNRGLRGGAMGGFAHG